MEATTKFLSIFLLCSLFIGGDSQPCTVDNLKITQSKTGKSVQGQPEWNVTITNDCICDQVNIEINSPGFQSVENIDPSILGKSGDNYLVNHGNPIHYQDNFSFTYAWATQFTFKPVYSLVQCSA
uniref:uncharacterized protein LOC105351747 n=1 Tax=Fragaria vesca subsp. vesca TaxID=101020 RepID=UPI0005CA49D0|nr:PREDICTED: uncharacterized protein LOC105351747 [Fragaria vesca subsp. vesca]